jgi:multidrug efflux pump subunit AcrB
MRSVMMSPNFWTLLWKRFIHTLVEAFILVAIVVFLFLGDWRSTLIPTIAVPVSLVGSFLFMQFFGITINLITLFALVLAIGVVVDDAIVVIEAVHAKMEELHISAYKATKKAMHEISGAIIAITFLNGSGIYTCCLYVGTCRYILSSVLHYNGDLYHLIGG